MEDNFKKITFEEWKNMDEMEQVNYLSKASRRFMRGQKQTTTQHQKESMN